MPVFAADDFEVAFLLGGQAFVAAHDDHAGWIHDLERQSGRKLSLVAFIELRFACLPPSIQVVQVLLKLHDRAAQLAHGHMVVAVGVARNDTLGEGLFDFDRIDVAGGIDEQEVDASVLVRQAVAHRCFAKRFDVFGVYEQEDLQDFFLPLGFVVGPFGRGQHRFDLLDQIRKFSGFVLAKLLTRLRTLRRGFALHVAPVVGGMVCLDRHVVADHAADTAPGIFLQFVGGRELSKHFFENGLRQRVGRIASNAEFGEPVVVKASKDRDVGFCNEGLPLKGQRVVQEEIVADVQKPSVDSGVASENGK